MNQIDHALVDALATPTGAVPNGRLPRIYSERRPHTPLPGNSPVNTVRPGVQGWACDACDTDGAGLPTMYAHTTDTGHTRFTAV